MSPGAACFRDLTIVLATTLVVGSCCRPKPPPDPADAAPVVAPSASAGPVAAPTLRLQAPFAASLHGDRVRLFGVDRAGGGLVLAALGLDGALVETRAIAGDPAQDAKLEDVDLFVGEGGLALITEGASGATRLSRADSAPAAGNAWEPIESATCATRSSVVTLGRGDGGLLVTARPFSPSAAPVVQVLGAASSSSLLCAGTSAFVLREDGGKRLGTRVGGDHAEALLATDVGTGEEQTITYQADGDGVLVTRVGSRTGFAFRSWRGAGEPPTPWSAPLPLPDDSTIELVLTSPDDVALIVSHPVPASRDCKNGDDADVVAEAIVIARDTGKPRRGRDRLERWSCGADAGPFYGGAIGRRLVVSWPRGADTACAKVGARFGGLAFAVLSSDAAAHVERRDAVSEAIEDAGCDGERCAVVVLGRGDASGCVPASAPTAGEPRVVFYP